MVQSGVTISTKMRGWVAKSGVQQICHKKTLTVEDWWMISYQKKSAWSWLKLFEVGE